MVYTIHTGGRKGSLILSNNRAIVLQQGGQCRRAGAMKGWFIRARQHRRKRISCKSQVRGWVRGGGRGALAFTYKILFHFEAFVHESIILSLAPSTCIARSIAILLHVYCPIYDAPPTTLLYVTHHTILVILISCKGQGLRGGGGWGAGRGKRLGRGVGWPIQDILILVCVCARIQNPFITPAYSHYPHHCNTIARLLHNI